MAQPLRIVIVPGLHDSGPAHWQSVWQRRWRASARDAGPDVGIDVARVMQDDWEQPRLADWAARVGDTLRQSDRPTVIVAHSFGCLASLCAQAPPQLCGALLVAPASPDKFGVADALARARPAFPTRVVASRDDPWMRFDDARQWAARWGSVFADAGALGHINADSGLGEWAYGVEQLAILLDGAGQRPMPKIGQA